MDPPGSDERHAEARSATFALLARRAPDSTICPSEVARSIAAAGGTPDWRRRMPEVHAAIDSMVADGLVRLSWKGEPLPARDGPYRIGRGGPDQVESRDRDGSGVRLTSFPARSFGRRTG